MSGKRTLRRGSNRGKNEDGREAVGSCSAPSPAQAEAVQKQAKFHVLWNGPLVVSVSVVIIHGPWQRAPELYVLAVANLATPW